MLSSIVQFFADYLKGKPITDVLLIVFIAVFLWIEKGHGERTTEAHQVLHKILQERDANEQLRTDSNERNTKLIVTALTGVKQEMKANTAEVKKTTVAVKEIPEAAAVAAKKIVDKKLDDEEP
jgi:hypothetical protein